MTPSLMPNCRLGIALDYSEQSLEGVDRILAEFTKAGLLVPDDLSAAERDELWVFCKMLGGYVGEVIIRDLGGEWQTKETEDGTTAVKLVTAGVEGSPPGGRLGAAHRTVQGYRVVLSGAEGHPGSRRRNGGSWNSDGWPSPAFCATAGTAVPRGNTTVVEVLVSQGRPHEAMQRTPLCGLLI